MSPDIPLSHKRVRTTLLGFFALFVTVLVVWPTPEWYAYLNWMPGVAAGTLGVLSYMIPFAVTATIFMRIARLGDHALIPLLLACCFWLINSKDVTRQAGYLTGLAKVECWSPGSRECLAGKFEKLEHLKNPKLPVVLTEKEQAVFQAFKQIRTQFEASKPSGFGKEYREWAASYKAALDKVFVGYPSVFPL